MKEALIEKARVNDELRTMKARAGGVHAKNGNLDNGGWDIYIFFYCMFSSFHGKLACWLIVGFAISMVCIISHGKLADILTVFTEDVDVFFVKPDRGFDVGLDRALLSVLIAAAGEIS